MRIIFDFMGLNWGFVFAYAARFARQGICIGFKRVSKRVASDTFRIHHLPAVFVPKVKRVGDPNGNTIVRVTMHIPWRSLEEIREKDFHVLFDHLNHSHYHKRY